MWARRFKPHQFPGVAAEVETFRIGEMPARVMFAPAEATAAKDWDEDDSESSQDWIKDAANARSRGCRSDRTNTFS